MFKNISIFKDETSLPEKKSDRALTLCRHVAYAYMISVFTISIAQARMLLSRPVHSKAFSAFSCSVYTLHLLHALYEPFKAFLRLPVNVGKICIQFTACKKIDVCNPAVMLAKPELYEQCETNGVSYVIRLKENRTLRALASDIDDRLTDATKHDLVSYAVCYGEFLYQTGLWKYPRRIVCKVEKPTDQLIHMYTFIVTNMDSSPEELIRFYCKRGRMENFIKESKNGFDFTAVSSSSKFVNANRLQIHALAYNIFNWFKRLVLSAKMRKQQIDTIRLKLLKIAAKAVHSARYITFKLCSSCPYKDEFYETLENIRSLQPQLE